MKITIVIPLRVSQYLYEAEDRLNRIVQTVPRDKFSIVIVDYGTPAEHRAVLEPLIAHGVSIVKVDAADHPFSIGHARDIGVQHAATDVVLFHDIDFACSRAMYLRVHAEVESRNMSERAYDFFCVPVFFLSEHGSNLAREHFKQADGDHALHSAIYTSQPGVTEFAAYGSSAIVVNKWHYLGLGGHSREFYGHGAEDYDLLHRLSVYSPKGPRTKDYYVDTKNNGIGEYRGFRAYFALHGLDVFARGVFMVHLWHPKREIPGYHQSNRNFHLLRELMTRFDRDECQPSPLGNLHGSERALVLMDHQSSSFSAVRHALPLIGDFDVLPESVFVDASALTGYCRKKQIKRVVFLNPYGNEHRLGLYRGVREAGLPYFIFDRGALPDSWFFDPNGFNFDSSSYHPHAWDVPLSSADSTEVEAYIQDLRQGDQALELNGPRKSARYLREQLGFGNRRVLFVPFQRPSDTVTNFFAGAVGSVANFQNWVECVTKSLSPAEWVVVCKNHPLDADLPRVEGAVYVNGETHVNDLLDLADTVLLMNSGVGVLALAFGKPVICTADAFYSHPGLAYNARSPEHVVELLGRDLVVEREMVSRFYRHLLKEVYSFGAARYRSTKASDGSARTIVQRIVFRRVSLYGVRSLAFGEQPAGVSLDAPLFNSFGGRSGIKALLTQKPTLVKTAPKKSSPKAVDVKPQSELPELRRWRKLRKLVKHPHMFIRDYVAKRKGRSLWPA